MESEFQKMFEAVDGDNSGRISAIELQTALSSTGEPVGLEACQVLISLFDEGTGSVDLKGFKNLCQLPTKWKLVFQRFDQDKSGFIELNELGLALKEIFPDFELPSSFVRMLITKYGDPNRGTGLNKEQFLLACAFLEKSRE